MEILYYQGLIFITLVLVRVFAKKYLEIACFVWTALTLINLFWPPLIVLQLIVVWGTYGAIRPKAATTSPAENPRQTLSQFQPNAKQAKQRSDYSARSSARILPQDVDKAQSSQRKTETLSSPLADKAVESSQSYSLHYSGTQPISSSDQKKPLREIVLDTETTGFDPDTGDRIVEVGAVELMGHVATGRTYHQYINPERAMPDEAFQVHGLGDDFLRDKPRFAEVGHTLLEFIGDAQLVIHNAAFDMKFINAELRRMKLPQIPWERAVDTLEIARRRFPGSPASLDALCRRFGIDTSRRTRHGALLDSEILAEIYMELIGGRQRDFGPPTPTTNLQREFAEVAWQPRSRNKTLTLRRLTAEGTTFADAKSPSNPEPSGQSEVQRLLKTKHDPISTNRNVSIDRIVESRAIQHLVHFTQVENLPSIFREGLVSIEEARARGMNVRTNDADRYDGYLNAISLSVSFPNAPMFYKLRKLHPETDWAILLIDPAVLYEKKCGYCQFNAADKRIPKQSEDALVGAELLTGMFDRSIRSKDSEFLRPCDPTDPQAEVLVFEPIELAWIQKVVFFDEEVLRCYEDVVHRVQKSVDRSFLDSRSFFLNSLVSNHKGPRSRLSEIIPEEEIPF